MADPFQIPLAFLSITSAMFALFISIVVFAITILASRETNEEKEYQTQFIRTVFIKKFAPIAGIVFIVELFNSLVIFFITDKTFSDFYWFELCSYVIFILAFTVMFQFSIQLILFPFYSLKSQWEYNNKVSTFNQVTTFFAINFISIATYFFSIKRLEPSVGSMILSILLCVLSGLVIWYLFQKNKLKSVTTLALGIICLSKFSPYLTDNSSKVIQSEYINLTNPTNYPANLTQEITNSINLPANLTPEIPNSINFPAKLASELITSTNFQANLTLERLAVCTIPPILLLITQFNYIFRMTHQVSIKKSLFHVLDYCIEYFKSHK